MSILPKDTRILVLCHGNINRSPLAAALLRQLGFTHVREAALKPNGGGERAAKKMRDAALALGLSLEEHRSTKFTPELLAWAEIVIYMDGGNRRRLGTYAAEWYPSKLAPPIPGQEWLALGAYDDPPTARIADPAFIKRDSPEFDAVVQQIRRCTERFAAKHRKGDF